MDDFDVNQMRERAVSYLRRLWLFWGPRFTDRGFVGGVLANAAMLGVVSKDVGVLEPLTLAIWVAANFFFPTWDAFPAGDHLRPSPDQLSREASERQGLRELVSESLRTELEAYARGS